MRLKSLAIALLGAVAAAGCSGGSAPSSTGTSRGAPGSTYTIQVRGDTYWWDAANAVSTNRPRGGTVTSSPAGLNCGDANAVCAFDVAWGTTVTISVAYSGTSTVHAFAGDCNGSAGCVLTGNADRLLLVRFAATAAGLGGHPNFSDPAVHGPAYVASMRGDAGALDCRTCHGAELAGQGLAVSCSRCHAWPPPHDGARFQARFDPYLAVSMTGPNVTAICNGCHIRDAEAFMATQHWQWKGPTPQLYDVGTDWLASDILKGLGYGKANLINNFCVSTAGNEKRCDQCHAGYGKGPSGTASIDSAHVSTTYQADPNRVDCLICHAKSVTGNMAGGGYNKIAGAFGAAGYAVGPGAPLPTSAQLRTWATNLQRPTRENCGWCHFNGGGADSVKIMSTALRNPDASVDVHMSPAGGNLTCASCHADQDHKVKGAGVGTPNNFARTSCESCHGSAPHAGLDTWLAGELNAHTDTVACQTCHIPAYSRGMPGKVDWDWSTAGYKNIPTGTGGTVYACAPAAGGAMVPYGAGCATGYAKVKAYDFMKGNFVWAQNVAPRYAWYNGKMTHATTDDKGVFGTMGTTPDDRITLSQPLGSRSDPSAKIYPFKVMTGRQAVYVDDAAGNSFVVSPKLFMQVGGDGGFWGTISGQPPGTVHGYYYTPAAGEALDAYGAPTLPLDGSFIVTTNINGYTANQSYPFSQLLAQTFTLGAKAAAQVDGAAPTFVKYTGAGTAGWDWRYTQMYLDLEHEVAPKAQALGANDTCTACHQPYNPAAQVTDPTPFMQAVGYDADPGFVTTARRTP